MFIKKYLPQEAIAVHSYEDACALQKVLVENGNCVMLSREENLWLVNWIWTETPADRNCVIFTSRDEYECNMWKWHQDHPDVMCGEDEDEDEEEDW